MKEIQNIKVLRCFKSIFLNQVLSLSCVLVFNNDISVDIIKNLKVTD